MDNIGLYLHIPFCRSKCPYCDFYSFRCDEDEKDRYFIALLNEIKQNTYQFKCKANTLYIGGGTPSVIGSKRLSDIVYIAKSTILTDDAEITVECNPYGLENEFFNKLSASGVNRISLGLQSANDNERKTLGRRANCETVTKVIENIRKSGIDNISLDVMLGVPDSDINSLKNTLDFCISQKVPHISCYILKIEENTPFYKMQNNLNLPDDDKVADMYLFMCEYLEQHGIIQYEISNFAKPGFESRHNLKYWNDEEYLGIGAAAHSFIDGKRFYYPRDIEFFISGKEPIFDCNGGDFQEYSMLRLRLVDGLQNESVKERFGFDIPKEMYEKAEKFIDGKYLVCDEKGIHLTKNGFLISNFIISELI